MKTYIESDANKDKKDEKKKKDKKNKKESIVSKKDFGLSEGARIIME